jgi:hercynylcysteine S-oxide lyase
MRTFQDLVESKPDPYLRYDYPLLLDSARSAMSDFLNAPISTIVFVPNATTGINTVLRNLTFEKGDKIIYFSTIYGACEKSIQYVTETTPLEAVKIQYTYPVSDSFFTKALKKTVDEERQKGGRVRLCIFDVVSSLPGVRMPFEALTKTCRELGILSCIDGAHGVGHVDMDLGVLDPDFFVSNCHK